MRVAALPIDELLLRNERLFIVLIRNAVGIQIVNQDGLPTSISHRPETGWRRRLPLVGRINLY